MFASRRPKLHNTLTVTPFYVWLVIVITTYYMTQVWPAVYNLDGRAVNSKLNTAVNACSLLFTLCFERQTMHFDLEALNMNCQPIPHMATFVYPRWPSVAILDFWNSKAAPPLWDRPTDPENPTLAPNIMSLCCIQPELCYSLSI